MFSVANQHRNCGERNMFKVILLLQIASGLYTAPQRDGQSIIKVSTQTGVQDSVVVRSMSDTDVLLTVFGACVDANPIYKQVQSCGGVGVGPAGGRGGVLGPWVDTIRFNRLYRKSARALTRPGVVGPNEKLWEEDYWGDTVVVSSYYHKNVTFTIRRPDLIEFAIDSNHSIFRVIRGDHREEAWVIARYNNTLDSMRLYPSETGWCSPWPNCYYNPIKPMISELPRTYLDDMLAEARASDNQPSRDTVWFLEDMSMMCCGVCIDSTTTYVKCQKVRILPSGDTIVIGASLWPSCCGACRDTTQNYKPCERPKLPIIKPKKVPNVIQLITKVASSLQPSPILQPVVPYSVFFKHEEW